MSLLLALGGLISLTAVVTGVSVTIAKSKSDHSTSKVKAEEEKFEAVESKKCTVFLTNKDAAYVIVSCGGNPSTWYLFDKSRNSLERIQGISTPNSRDTSLGTPIDLWRDKFWTSFRKYDERLYKGSNAVGGAFQISYKFDAKTFPFFDHIKLICLPPLGVAIVPTDSDYKCTETKLYIPTTEFNKQKLKPEFPACTYFFYLYLSFMGLVG